MPTTIPLALPAILARLALLAALAAIAVEAPTPHLATLLPASVLAPERLGSLDDATLDRGDLDRLAVLREAGQLDAVTATFHGLPLDRRDVELLRQDRRRAMAAYPDVAFDDLTLGAWMRFDPSARVPFDWGGPNRSGSTVDGVEVLDGASYMSVVRPDHPDRAGPVATRAFFLERAARNAARDAAAGAALLVRHHLRTSSSSNGGYGAASEEATCTRMRGCVVRAGEPGQARERVWRFPFVPADWTREGGSPSLAAIRGMPSFAKATPRPGRPVALVLDQPPLRVVATCVVDGGSSNPILVPGVLVPGVEATSGTFGVTIVSSSTAPGAGAGWTLGSSGSGLASSSIGNGCSPTVSLGPAIPLGPPSAPPPKATASDGR